MDDDGCEQCAYRNANEPAEERSAGRKYSPGVAAPACQFNCISQIINAPISSAVVALPDSSANSSLRLRTSSGNSRLWNQGRLPIESCS